MTPRAYVYVAGPFSAPDRAGVEANIARAVEFGVELSRCGFFPVVPHANTSHPAYEHTQGYEFWIEGTKRMLLRVCDVIFLMPGWEKSSGARGEREAAEEAGLLVVDSIDELDASWGRLCFYYTGRQDPAKAEERQPA